MIRVRNLSFNYGKKEVLKNIDVSFGKGEFALIAGNNGAGKSTFLKCLVGALSPQSGQIIYSDSLSKKRVGYISDTLSFYENLSIGDAIDFHRRVYDTEPLDDTLIRQLDLDRKERVKELSVGERTLFLLALIMNKKPELLLIDEIIHAIDPYLRELFLENLLDVIGRYNTTVIAVNHIFSEIEAIPGRVLVMEKGNFVVDENTDQLKARIKKIEMGPGEQLSADLPVIFKKETAYYKEYYIYPFKVEMAESFKYQFIDLELSEIMKSFIGGHYVKNRK